MNLKEQRAAEIKAAQDIIDGAKADGRDLTVDEQTAVEGHFKAVEEKDAQIKAAAKSDALMGQITSLGPVEGDVEPEGAKSLGEHFVKSVGEQGLARVKTVTGTVVSAPEFKAATDTHQTPNSLAPWVTDYDRTIVRGLRRPVVSDLLGTGSISGNAVTYLVEGAVEGGFSNVAAGGAKPQFHMTDPTQRTDALRKIAGFIKFTDEMVEDAAFWVSEINERGLYMLSLYEENQLLNGTGAGQNLLGIRGRAGVQSETALNTDDNADALFRAIAKVQSATGLSADGVVINPADYQALRLGKDGNGQYFGGGYFQGQYGNGGMDWQPPVWGLRTVVSAAIEQGTALVGAFNAASTVYRKGGVRVESTNSHDDDFTNNLITTRIEERIALAVRYPAAFVEVELASDVPADESSSAA